MYQKKQVSFSRFMASVAGELEAEERFGTARIYRAALGAVTLFAGGGEVFFGALTPVWLKKFETHLRSRQRQWNTVSTYMRMLRATYNRAVAQGRTSAAPGLFKGVYTGVKRERKLSLTAQEMHRLIYAPLRRSVSADVEKSRECLKLMFQLQGIPFVDLVHLHRSDLDKVSHTLSCHRQKTGTPLEIILPPATWQLIAQHGNGDKKASPYLLDILSGESEGAAAYEEYQRILRALNRNLKTLARVQGINARISSYTARHTWATLAKYCGVPEGLICDALGHTSVKTTETYLKSFDNKSLEKANRKVVALVRRAVTL